jgi:DNA-directed RNA polymerase specialized sigma24 family protein
MFKDDMISDGIENCIQYLHNFNPEKSTNPFAYFTQIIHYAFLRRIQREKRQLEIKNKILEKTGFDEVFTNDSGIDGENYSDYNSIKETVHIKMRY